MSVASTLHSPATVMVVDDDEFVLESMCEALSPLRLGVVATALDGRAALRLIKASPRPPEVLICDVYMPNMDGLEFLDQLAQMQFKGGVIVVSGQNIDMLDIAHELARGSGLRVLGAFVKPVTQAQLCDAIGFTFNN